MGIKQVSVHIASKFARGSTGINAWNAFSLRVEYPYIVRKSKKPPDMGEPTFNAKKLHVTDCTSKPKVHVLTLANYSRKLHKMLSIRASAHGIRRFR